MIFTGTARIGGCKFERYVRSVSVPACTVDFVRAIVGAGREFCDRAITAELQIFLRPSRGRNVRLGIMIDRPRVCIIDVNMHPPLANQRVRPVYHSDLLGPSSVARMRATCCAVNMNIESSST